MHLPLSGFRILSVEAYGAGPYGTMMLAQLGAEVIKIEPPDNGDSARDTGPHFLGPHDSRCDRCRVCPKAGCRRHRR